MTPELLIQIDALTDVEAVRLLAYIKRTRKPDQTAIIKSTLGAFCYEKLLLKGSNDVAYFDGRALFNPFTNEFTLSPVKFREYLASCGYSFTRQQIRAALIDTGVVLAKPNTTVGEKQTRPWIVNLSAE